LSKNITNNKVNRRGRSSRATSFAYKGASMSKKPKKSNNQPHPHAQNNHFELRTIKPLTPNQQKTFDAYHQGYNLMLHGSPGTGKTFCALYLALQEVLHESKYEKIILIRSVVPSRDMGFLPGSMKEKIAVYEEPYREICDSLFGRGDGYDILKMKKIVHFTSTSFLRGVTFNNSIVILDEAQNLESHEINTVMTRIGDNSKVVVCGDFKQTDLVKRYDRQGITELMAITRHIQSFAHVEFGPNDIIRSGLVREYILAREKLNL
jgi:phosphate starvation-inducible protein PhoH